MSEKNYPRRGTPRADLIETDRQILRLLLKRFNLLEKLRARGRLEPADEKAVREEWQKEAARVSRDPSLSGAFFSLMQTLTFLPKPSETEETPKRAEAFNLAPPKKPVDIRLDAPLDNRSVKNWLFLAASAGLPIRLEPCSLNDSLVDFEEALNRLGASAARNDKALFTRQRPPMPAPDKVIYVGDDAYNFYLLLAHYLGRPSRAKFTGSARLKLANFSALDRALPLLGARLAHVVPRNYGLPARVECSGVLPAAFDANPELPAGFVAALILAAPFYETPLGIDLRPHPRKAEILAQTLPILNQCGASYRLGEDSINLEPSSPACPETPVIPDDATIASILLAFAMPRGGSVNLAGSWPDTPEAELFARLCESLELPWRLTDGAIDAKSADPIKKFIAAETNWRHVRPERPPILVALAACAALNGGMASLPPEVARDETAGDFLRSVGLVANDMGELRPDSANAGSVWIAPTAEWAAALAITSLSRPSPNGFKLGNPGIITELWPAFWGLYNSLPTPRDKKCREEPKAETGKRRRIRTEVAAKLPEIREED